MKGNSGVVESLHVCRLWQMTVQRGKPLILPQVTPFVHCRHGIVLQLHLCLRIKRNMLRRL